MPYVEYDEVEAVCSDCGRVFRSEEALADHRVEAHGGDEGAKRPPPTVRRLKCSLCDRTFRSADSLKEHTARAHSG